MTDVMTMNSFCELSNNEMLKTDGGCFCFSFHEQVGNYVARYASHHTSKKINKDVFNSVFTRIPTYESSSGGGGVS